MCNAKMDIDDFVEKNERAVFRYCLSLCGRKELAEEIMQETFLRLLANSALISMLPEGKRLAWAFTTAKHLVFDGLRVRKCEEKFLEENLECDAAEEPALGVEKLLAGASPELRELLIMKFELGMNSREISEKLAVPAGTVRRRIQLGLAKIKEELEN